MRTTTWSRLAVALPLVLADEFQTKCLSFKPEQYINGAVRNVLQHIPSGTNVSFIDNDATCNRPNQVVDTDFCRIALSVPTSNTSRITFEAWLPEEWSGRFLATGNGGIDGCIKYEDLAYGADNGFATVGANNGKNGTSGVAFLNKPEVVTDFAWRSLHTSTKVGKLLTKTFYEKTYTKSYYIGCSLGGRQGIKAAEKFPDDFDGIIAGAPGVDFNNLYSWRAWFYTVTGPSTGVNFISATAWKTWIHEEILRQCDTIDGVKDGIIEDPTICKFDPETLLCGQSNTTYCLNNQQVQQLKTIFSDYRYPDGKLIFPAMSPGGEINSASGLYAGVPWPLSQDWFRYVIYSDPTWNASTYNYSSAALSERINPSNIRTYPSSLPGFENRGGKLLIYHGQQDNQISPFNSNRFYERLRGKRSYESMDEWMRMFRVSGMFHCSTGPGAWVLGQGGNAAQRGIPYDRRYNVLKALIDWVEQGEGPETIEGTKFVNDTVSLGIDFQRRHCKYPARNTYKGGDYKDPGNWECR